MKRILALVLSLVCCISCLIFPTTATDTNMQPETEEILSVTRIDLPDGGFIIEEITETDTASVARATSTKTGTKTSTRYTASGTAIFAVKVTGTFSYTGSSSWATSSSATVYTYVSSATYVSKNAYYSGRTAYATGTVSYLGSNTSRTVALTCSATGVLS